MNIRRSEQQIWPNLTNKQTIDTPLTIYKVQQQRSEMNNCQKCIYQPYSGGCGVGGASCCKSHLSPISAPPQHTHISVFFFLKDLP